jgi:hypothetical protein
MKRYRRLELEPVSPNHDLFWGLLIGLSVGVLIAIMAGAGRKPPAPAGQLRYDDSGAISSWQWRWDGTAGGIPEVRPYEYDYSPNYIHESGPETKEQ